MASSSRRRGKQTTVAPEKPHFLSITRNDDAMKREKLCIPRKFVRDYGNGLPNSVLLKVPGGELFKVKVSKAGDNEVFLQDGWGDFADYYSIDFGHFLLFEYDRNSRFTVKIIDISATEIDYPCNNRVGSSEEPHEHSENDDSVIRISSDSDSDSDLAKCAEWSQSCSVNREEIRRKGFRGNQPLAVGESVFPVFAVKMERTKVPPQSILGVPNWFAKKYITEDKDDVTLHVLNKGTWKAKCRVCQTKTGSRVRFVKGWSKFAMGNHLAVGDICVFHMIRNDKSVVFQVLISRQSKLSKHKQ